MVVKTPSGYLVTIKDFITFGQRRQLEHILLSSSKVNPETKKLGDISPSVLYEMQDKAVGLLVEKIQKGEVVITTDFVKEINEWPEADGSAVYNEINRITSPDKEQGEKK